MHPTEQASVSPAAWVRRRRLRRLPAAHEGRSQGELGVFLPILLIFALGVLGMAQTSQQAVQQYLLEHTTSAAAPSSTTAATYSTWSPAYFATGLPHTRFSVSTDAEVAFVASPPKHPPVSTLRVTGKSRVLAVYTSGVNPGMWRKTANSSISAGGVDVDRIMQ